MAAQSKKTVKKQFFEVGSSITSAKVAVYGSTMEEMVGKVVTVDLTRNLRGKSFEMKMKVVQKGSQLEGEPMNLWLAGSYVRRMIRKGIDYVEDSFEVECKDGKARVKPFLITRNKVSRGVRNKLRVASKQFVESYVRTKTTEEIFSDIMANKMQKELSMRLKKIYPLALCEIRVFEIIFEKKGLDEAK